MKKITLLLCFFTTVGFAQISYLSTDYATQNESFIVSTATVPGLTLDFVQTGTNFNWNYSTLAPATQETVTFQNPNSAGYKNIWCLFNGFIFNCNTQFNNNFNLATKLTDGLQIQGLGLTNVIDHLQVTATALQDKMIGASITANGITIPFVASFQSPDVVYQFPINYNDNYTNNSALSLDLNSFGVPIQIANTGQRTNVVDGWGSLTTPFGTFANVLKMKTTLVNNITITNNGTPTQTTVTTVSYKWFDAAYGIPVLQVDGTLVANQWVPNLITYFDIQRCLTPTALFAYLPVVSDFNPTTNSASVSFINLSTNFDTLSWNFGDGSAAVTTANPTHNFTCPGVKQVTLTVTNAFCTPDQIDTIIIPVTITDTQNAFTTNVTVGNASLFADRTITGTTYQWLDCDNNNQPIPNATEQIFTPPAVNGHYAVRLTTNGCVSFSDCYSLTTLGIITVDENTSVSLFPNPTRGKIFISNDELVIKDVSVYNVLGALVAKTLDLTSQAKGLYIVKITTDNGSIIRKISKE